MSNPTLAPGDRVVDLAASLRAAALVAGASACAVSVWVLKRSVLWALAALILGAIGGFGVGFVLGLVTFRAAPGQALVVKLGPGALAQVLKANLIGACISGLMAAAAPALLLAEFSKLAPLAALGAGIGIVVGGVLGYLASRS